MGVGSLSADLCAALSGRPGVRLAYLFGSATAGHLRAGSDVDVAIRFAARPSLDELAELGTDLERIAGRRVDLIDVDAAPPLLQREIVLEGRLLWAVSDDERVAFETRALARYMDTAHLRRVQRQYLHQWAEGYRARSR
jgi:predicted nucleotidyltransferase